MLLLYAPYFGFRNPVDEKLSYYYHNATQEGKGLFGRIWRWFVTHSGVQMFGDVCGFNLICGDCPGICFRVSKSENPFVSVPNDYSVTPEEYDQGLRVLQFALYNDTTLAVHFVDDHLVYQDTLYIFADENMGGDVASVFEVDSVVMPEGGYFGVIVPVFSA
jgi:hypothetical protein